MNPNVVLLTVDSLRFDHLGCYGYRIETSPEIDKLAASGVLFRNAIANGGGTPESFQSIILGALPPFHWNRYQIGSCGGLPKYFKNRGYDTGAFHSNPYISRYFGYSQFFDRFEDNLAELKVDSDNSMRSKAFFLACSLLAKIPLHSFQPVFDLFGGDRIISALTEQHGKKTATQITDQAIHWIKQQKNEFFLWVHYMDVHVPYLPPTRYFSTRRDRRISLGKLISIYSRALKGYDQLKYDDVQDLIALYDCCIRYVDDEIGRLLGFLKKIPSETIVILTADHGDAFGEHGRFNHGDLYDEIIHVPLIIHSPGLESKIDDELVCSMQLIDIISSLVEHGSIDAKETPDGIISVALDPFRKTRSVSFRTRKWKYIRNECLSTGKEFSVASQELYDLDSDIAELSNLSSAQPVTTSQFEQRIQSIVSAVTFDKANQGSVMTIEDERLIAERLGRLGYE